MRRGRYHFAWSWRESWSKCCLVCCKCGLYFQAEELDDFYQDYRVVGYEGFEEAELGSGKEGLAVLGD